MQTIRTSIAKGRQQTQIPLLLAIAVPWLNPFSQSPSVSVLPLLVSWTCAAGLVLTCWPRCAPLAIAKPLGALALVVAGTAVLADGTIPGTDGLALIVSLLAILACAMRFANATRWDATVLARAWLVAGAASVFMGWLQYAGAADALAPWVSGTHPGEAFGNLRQRNLYASLTSIALCALLWLARTDPWFNRPALLAGLAALLSAGNALSHSRTGLFELVLILGLAWAWGLHRERTVRWTLGPVLPAYLATALGLPLLFNAAANPGIFTRLAEGAPLCSSRMTLWSNVLELIRQKPWSGWGWGQLDFAHFMTLYDGPRFCDILDNAHNLPLHLAVELGVPVALLVCGAGLWAVWRARPWREADPLRQMAWAVLAVILLHSLLEYPLWYGPFQMAFGISLGLSSRLPLRPTVRTEFIGPALLTSLMLVSVASAAWDYHRIRQIYLPPEERAAAYRDNTLAKVREAWLFRDQARFAELTITPLKRDNAEWTFATAKALLHFSPEPRVIEKVIESAVMLGQDGQAMLYLARYRAAFPKEHARWAENLNAATGVGKPDD